MNGTQQIPFNDLVALEEQLRTKRYAALLLEPIQGEGGIRIPNADYLRTAHSLCRRYGTLLVLDEVQTGFFRTGKFLASHHYSAEPDMIVLAKALSGGLVPSGAVLMIGAIYESVYGSIKRSLIHTSRFSENGLAMRVGLSVLDALEAEDVAFRSTLSGTYMRNQLRERLAGFEMVAEVRGEGLFTGIVFRPPRASVTHCLSGFHEDTSGDVWASSCHQALSRPWHHRTDLWKQLYGFKARSTVDY